jgi:hypothetical protein
MVELEGTMPGESGQGAVNAGGEIGRNNGEVTTPGGVKHKWLYPLWNQSIECEIESAPGRFGLGVSVRRQQLPGELGRYC